MSQTVTFYNTSSDPKQVNKAITPAKPENNAVTYYLTRPCNVINPVITTSYDSSFASANYCHIGSPFNRYYYIKNVNLIPGGKMEIICEVDPLMSWKGDRTNPGFLQSKATIIRAENPKSSQGKDKKPTLVADGKFPLHTNKREIFIDNFADTPFYSNDIQNLRPYILTTIGGSSSNSSTPQPIGGET